MLKNPIGSGGEEPPPEPPPTEVTGPYAQSEINFIYQLLFCDQPELFHPQPSQPPAPWQEVLFSSQPDMAAVRALAENRNEGARVRVLAYSWLRQNGQDVPKQELLGAIIEVPLDEGLDVLAAYVDGTVRYINQTGKLTIFEPSAGDVATQANRLLAASQTAIGRIGPWDKPRLPPPGPGLIRMTFLVSDGLYFGQGPLTAMEQDPIGASIVGEAGRLLQVVVDTALAAEK
jgi:hypothetical protein